MNQMLLRGLASGAIKPKGPVAAAGRAAQTYSNKTAELQDALVNLIGRNEAANPDTVRSMVGRMAGSPEALAAIRVGIPAAVIAAPAINFAENESYANQAMDLLGMGAGAYGMHKGLVGRSTAGLPVNRNAATAAVLGSAVAGMAGSDAIQLLLGGGRG